ncbi:MAG: type II toxin-antitoxin system VapC family toxin [Isosphaeraceae bacterium]
MIVYLDSVIVIYLIEGPDPFRGRAEARLAQITAANDQVASSHLTRLECRVKPIRLSDASLLADFEAFFNNPDLLRFALPETVFERATVIRAQYNLKLGDSLHLAAAVEHGCGLFLTNDVQLRRFPDIPVEVLT